MSKNHSSCCPVLLTGGDRHFFTDTLCLRTPMLIFLLCPEFPENQICAPQKTDSSGKKIFSSNLTNPQLLKWRTVSVWRREAYWQSRLSWPEEASTRTHDPTSRGRTLPTMRGLWSSNHIGIWKPQTEYCKKFNWIPKSKHLYIF